MRVVVVRARSGISRATRRAWLLLLLKRNSWRSPQVSPPSTENWSKTGWERGSGAALPQPRRRKNWTNLQPLTDETTLSPCLKGESSYARLQLYLALERSRSLVTSMRRPSSLKNRWFPLDMIPHFLDGFPPLSSLKCSASTAPPAHIRYTQASNKIS